MDNTTQLRNTESRLLNNVLCSLKLFSSRTLYWIWIQFLPPPCTYMQCIFSGSLETRINCLVREVNRIAHHASRWGVASGCSPHVSLMGEYYSITLTLECSWKVKITNPKALSIAIIILNFELSIINLSRLVILNFELNINNSSQLVIVYFELNIIALSRLIWILN